MAIVTDSSAPPFTREQLCERYIASVRHSAELGIEMLAAREESVRARLPWQDRLVGNPDTGIIHGGAIFAFLDQLGGLAAAMRVFPAVEITPTIDFRIDHLRAPDSGRAVVGEACCYRLSEHVAFVRLEAFAEGSDEPVSTGLATYMRMKLPTAGGLVNGGRKEEGSA